MSSPSNTPSKAKGIVEFASQQPLTLSLTDQLSTEDGALKKDTSRNQIEFTIQYQGYWFAIKATQEGTNALLRIHAVLGHLPYSYESTFARTNVMAVVREATKVLRAHVHFDDQQRIIFTDDIRLGGSLTPKFILAETTKLLLQIKPYLELLTAVQPPKRRITTV